ncbi:hypothetical protein JIN85_13570 [Luteolibacter pohnpeiensis]|uniref:Uncharacterized protein n=1 Tax=Luteolibacter pohnpeiensis TaxID=454153 RepID=A0A934S5G2_9BACT|nr:hypothetical protein [Luteolibacter pohnpeiensis]MBK1883450.1 hypothetical protein [Luteolibacter pohnpeiensis]
MNIPRNIFKLAAILVMWSSSAQAEEQAVEFNAKITEIKNARRYDSTTIVTGVDPRFLVRVILLEDAPGVGKAGDAINFAIHSPARELLITDIEEATSKPIRLNLVQPSKSLKLLRRAETKNSQQDVTGNGYSPVPGL